MNALDRFASVRAPPFREFYVALETQRRFFNTLSTFFTSFRAPRPRPRAALPRPPSVLLGQPLARFERFEHAFNSIP